MEKNDRNLEISIITPERIVYQDWGDYVSVPCSEGVIGVYFGHTPLFTQISQGEVVVHQGKERRHLSVSGGFVEIGGKKVTILADTALRSEELEEEKILEAKKIAEERMKQKLSRQEYLAVESQLRKILLDLKVATRKKSRYTPTPPSGQS